MIRELFRSGVDFFKLEPRLGRIRFLTLFIFWMSMIFFGILWAFVGKAIDAIHKSTIFEPIGIVIAIIFFIIAFINLISNKIRRLHDFNIKGW